MPIAAPSLVFCATLLAVDGDTIRCDGERMRLLGDGMPFVSGVDAPEIRGAGCSRERLLGQQAKRRLGELLAQRGIKIEDSGMRDSWRRPLVRVRMPDGRTAGAVLIEEGMATIWQPGQQHDWCLSR